MLSFLIAKISGWLEQAERGRTDAYLASASDLPELERRIRAIDRGQFQPQTEGN